MFKWNRLIRRSLDDQRRLPEIRDHFHRVRGTEVAFLKRTEARFENRPGVHVILENPRKAAERRECYGAGKTIVLCGGDEGHRSACGLACGPDFLNDALQKFGATRHIRRPEAQIGMTCGFSVAALLQAKRVVAGVGKSLEKIVVLIAATPAMAKDDSFTAAFLRDPHDGIQVRIIASNKEG